jgi:hypothetical protein
MPKVVIPAPSAYLVFGFSCVTLYYKERLVFFDLLVKRGAFFATALVGLTLVFAIAARAFEPNSRPIEPSVDRHAASDAVLADGTLDLRAARLIDRTGCGAASLPRTSSGALFASAGFGICCWRVCDRATVAAR